MFHQWPVLIRSIESLTTCPPQALPAGFPTFTPRNFPHCNLNAMKTAIIAIALIGLAAVAQAEKGPTCKTWVRSPKTCNIPAGTCCGDPYMCNSRTGDGQCDYASSVNKPQTLPGSTTTPTTLPGSTTTPTTKPTGSACPTSGCDRICPGQSRGGAPPCNCGYTFCSGKCIANDQADKRFQSEGKPIPPCKGA